MTAAIPAGTGTWDFNPVGYGQGAVTFTGTVLFPGGINPGTTQTASMVFGPLGAVINIPPLASGEPGPSSLFRYFKPIAVPYGQALPEPAGQPVLVSKGGPGVPAVYDLVMYYNAAQPGEQGPSGSIVGSSDVQSGTPPNGVTLLWDELTDTWNYVSAWITDVITGKPTTSPSATTTSRTLDQVPYGPYDYATLPQPFGQCVISGTQNTTVTISANVGSADGPQVGVGYGYGGAGPVQISMSPWCPNPTAATVAAEQTTTIFYTATQTTATLDPWGTVDSQTTITVNATPVL